MIQRIVLVVLNGLGVGPLPDRDVSTGRPPASGAVDEARGVLAQLVTHVESLRLPHLETLGLGHITRHPRLLRLDQPDGCFGRVRRESPGLDPLTTYWELGGLPRAEELPSFRGAVPPDVVRVIEQVAQRPVLQPPTDILEELLGRHATHALREKGLLLWGEVGASCCLAAHESVLPPKDLFRVVREVRTAAKETSLRRLGARPYTGTSGALEWAPGWRDNVMPPPAKTLFDYLSGAVQLITSFGKCGDFFNGSGFTRSLPVEDTAAVWMDLLKTLKTTPRGLIVANLFDDLQRAPRERYGHLLADQLQEFDVHLPELQALLKPGDMVIVTSDGSRDLDAPEQWEAQYAPLIVFGPKLARGVNLGDRRSYADIGQTIADALAAPELSVGESFLPALRPG
ncbi:MAG: hypothetical protein U0172_04385 [Nitrospiraceae bacterium]